jgi:hypothetical protein
MEMNVRASLNPGLVQVDYSPSERCAEANSVGCPSLSLVTMLTELPRLFGLVTLGILQIVPRRFLAFHVRYTTDILPFYVTPSLTFVGFADTRMDGQLFV